MTTLNVRSLHAPRTWGLPNLGALVSAVLDVFAEEPLPQNNPLWKAKNIFITPHVGGPVPHYTQLLTEIFIDNLKRFLAGQPLATVVDKAKGY